MAPGDGRAAARPLLGVSPAVTCTQAGFIPCTSKGMNSCCCSKELGLCSSCRESSAEQGHVSCHHIIWSLGWWHHVPGDLVQQLFLEFQCPQTCPSTIPSRIGRPGLLCSKIYLELLLQTQIWDTGIAAQGALPQGSLLSVNLWPPSPVPPPLPELGARGGDPVTAR